MPNPALPRFLLTEYASTPGGGYALSNNPFIIHTQHPRFIALIDERRILIPVDFLGQTLNRDELQEALHEAAKFATHYEQHLELDDEADCTVTAVDLNAGPINLDRVPDYGVWEYKTGSDRLGGA